MDAATMRFAVRQRERLKRMQRAVRVEVAAFERKHKPTRKRRLAMADLLERAGRRGVAMTLYQAWRRTREKDG